MKVENGENREFIVTDTETAQSVTLVANNVEEKDEWVKRIKKEVRNIDKLVKKLIRQAVSIDPESPPCNKYDIDFFNFVDINSLLKKQNSHLF